MKTSLSKERHFVLANNENKIIAIIQSNPGGQDISEKIIKAISEDYSYEEVTIKNQSETIDDFLEITDIPQLITDLTYELDFVVEISYSKNDKTEEVMTLYRTEMY